LKLAQINIFGCTKDSKPGRILRKVFKAK